MLVIVVEEVLYSEIVGVILFGVVTADVLLVVGESALLDVELAIDVARAAVVESEVGRGVVVRAQVKGSFSWSLNMLKFPLLPSPLLSNRP